MYIIIASCEKIYIGNELIVMETQISPTHGRGFSSTENMAHIYVFIKKHGLYIFRIHY